MFAPGCGGGSKDTTTQVATSDGRPSAKAAYIEVADTVCRNHQSRREDLESQASSIGALTSKEKAHDVADLLREESANRRAEVEELRGLHPPASDAATVNSILALVSRETNVIDSWAGSYDAGDAQGIRRLQIRLGLTAGKAAQHARSYGFEVCGQQ